MEKFNTSHYHDEAEIEVENGLIQFVRFFKSGTVKSEAYMLHPPKGRYVNQLTGKELDKLEGLVTFFEEEKKKKFLEEWIPNTRKQL